LLRDIFTELDFRSLIKEFCDNQNISSASTQYLGKDAGENACSTDLFSTGISQSASHIHSQSYSQSPLYAEKSETIAAIETTETFAALANTPHTYHVVQSIDEVKALASLLLQQEQFCFDTETDSLNPIDANLVGISFAIENGAAYYVPIGVAADVAVGVPVGNDDNNKADSGRSAILDILRTPLEDASIAKIGQNIKYDYLVLKHALNHGGGINVCGKFYDTMLMHYLIDPESPHNMDAMAKTYLHYAPIPIENLIGKKGKGQGNMMDVPLARIAEYAAEDADVTLRLFHHFLPLLKSNGLEELYKLYVDVEAPLITVLGDMEYEGVCVDAAALQALAKDMEHRVMSLVEEIRTMAGEPTLNVFSPKQLGEALFDKLKLSANARTTGKSKQYSTSEETLAVLKDAHPIVGKILEVRSIKKLLSSYVESLPALVNPRTGRIHTCFNQAVTATGRLSSANPNLQNIPVREEEGKRIRRTFVASCPDNVLLSADYSQVELRLMAHLSEDENLLQAFRNSEDVHTATAAKIYGIPLPQVTAQQRRNAKTANFGIIYGISAFGLSQRLDIPRSEAKILIDGYFAAYPKVRTYMDNIVVDARRKGYVETLCHRRRMLPNINSRNAMERGFSERNAINAPIQGSAADIIKIAMIRVAAAIRAQGLRSKMLLQVHDELVFDVPKVELEEMAALVRHEMENAYVLRIPLIVDIGVGENWVDAH
jgi:DNA polymerase-1